MKISLYIRSLTFVTDTRGQIGVSHPYAMREVENAFVTTRRLDDRLFETDSARALEIAAELPDEQRRQIQVIDVASLPGRWKAWRAGVHQFPAVVVDDRCYAGLEQASRALREACR